LDETLLATGRDGRLHGRIWRSDASESHSVLLMVHGLGDHGGSFFELAEHFTAIGFAVAAIDLPGHGQSPGKRGYVESYDSLLDDMDRFRSDVQKDTGGLPQVLIGHSMGGNLSLNYVLRATEFNHRPHACQSPLLALVLCAPILLPKDPPPRPQVFAAWLTGLAMRWISFSKPVDIDQLTRDRVRAETIEADRHRHSRISLYLATQILVQGRWAIDHARECELPTLVLYGDADALIDTTACQNVALRMGENATSISFAAMQHDLFADLGREDVIDELQQWLNSQAI